MGMEIGKMIVSFEGDMRKLDADIKETERKIRSLQARIDNLKSVGATPSSSPLLRDLNNQLKVAQGHHKTLQAAQKATGASARAMGQDLNNALSTVSPRLGALAGAAGPLTALAAGLVAVGAAAAGIYKLATFSQQLGAEIFDLSTKINFTAETLSTLKVAAELSGGSLASLSTSLGIFDRNIEEAHDKSSEMSRIFKALKIDINDNEQALRQSFTALLKLPAGYQQTALAMKLFGRSGKEILGVIKETGGDIDDFIAKMRDMGLVITSSGAKKADEFGDRLTILQNKIEALGRQIGSELVPVVDKAADDISGWLKQNQSELINTAKEAASLISALLKLANFIRDTSPVTFAVRIVRQVIDLGGSPESRGLESGTLDANSLNAPGIAPQIGPLSIFRKPPSGGPHVFSPFGTREQPAATPLDYGKPSGGRGGGGAKAQKDVLEALKNEVISLNTEFRKLDVELFNSANMTELAAQKAKLLDKVMGELSLKAQMEVSEIKDVDQALDAAIGSLPKKSQAAAQSLRELAIAKFKDNEQTRIAGELTKATEQLAKEWRQEIDNVRTGADSYAIAIQGLEKEYRKYGQTLSASTRAELENAAAMQRTLALTRERLTITAQTRPRFVLEDVDRDAVNAERPRIATVEEQIMRERMQMIRDDMRQLGNELTSIFSDSIRTGFEGGIKSGLATLAQGLLQIVQDIFLQKLAVGLGDLLGDLGTGGGLLGRILGGGAGAAANAIPWPTGAATGAGSRVGDTTATRQRTVTPRDVDSQTQSINSATTQQTQALSNQIQLTGQQIIQGLTPVQQGFWEGLLGAAIGGAVSGLTSNLLSGRGGPSGRSTSTVSDPDTGEILPGGGGTRPRRVGSRAEGGPVTAGLPYRVHQDELIVPMQDAMVYNKKQQMGGDTHYHYNIQLPPMPPGSYKSPASQRQLANQVLSALQGAKR